MKQRTTIRLAADLLAQARRKAASEGRTLTALIEEALRMVVPDVAGPAKAKRVQIRVSKATRGFSPGFEDNPHIATQEMEDADYIERLERGFE